jgi:nitroreductase/NAD-dependent dihydropyrimidine dehydrogenase PreA subunit
VVDEGRNQAPGRKREAGSNDNLNVKEGERAMRGQPVTVDEERCSVCGQCVDICLGGVLQETEGKIEVASPDWCNLCGHCVAVCAADAIQAGTDEPLALPDGKPIAPTQLMTLIRSRRSTRKFKKDPVPKELVEQVIEAARYAPTGANMQGMHFTVVAKPEKIDAVRERVVSNLDGRVSEWEALAEAHEKEGTPIPKELQIRVDLRHRYRELVETAKSGQDVIFYDAPVVILLHSDPTAVTPKDDADLMAMCMLLMAESLGLGTCLIGLLTATAVADQTLGELIHLPEGHRVQASMILGYPAVAFSNAPGRKPTRVSWMLG